MLRDGWTTIDVDVDDRGPVSARRTTFGRDGLRADEETLEASGFGCARASYTQESSGLVAQVECESQRPSASDKAFVDPDLPEAP